MNKSKIISKHIIFKLIRSLCLVFSFIRNIWNVCNHCAGYICKSKRVTYILWAYLRNLRYNVFYKCVLKAIFKSNLINMGSILFIHREAHLFPCTKPIFHLFIYELHWNIQHPLLLNKKLDTKKNIDLYFVWLAYLICTEQTQNFIKYVLKQNTWM